MNATHRAGMRSAVLIALLIATIVAGLAGEPFAEAKKRTHRKRSTTITRTFANTKAIVMPVQTGPATLYPSSITVSGFSQGRIVDVDLRLHGLSHVFPSDIDVLLAAPDGRTALVLSDRGGDAATTNLTVTLDDEGQSLGQFEALKATPIHPSDLDDGFPDLFAAPAPPLLGNVALSAFDGIDPNGVWSLYMMDDVSGGDGEVTGGWSLTIKAVVEHERHQKGRHGGRDRG